MVGWIRGVARVGRRLQLGSRHQRRGRKSKNQVLYYDFKGGGWYWISYPSYEGYLEEVLGLLKAREYFPAEDDLTEDQLYEVWNDLLRSRTADSVEWS